MGRFPIGDADRRRVMRSIQDRLGLSTPIADLNIQNLQINSLRWDSIR